MTFVVLGSVDVSSPRCAANPNQIGVVAVIEIKIPERLNHLIAIKFNSELSKYDGIGKYHFDFSLVKFAEPFAMLFLAQSIKNFRETHKSRATFTRTTESNMSDKPACSYMAHVGFFKHININYGNETGKTPGGSTYIPITEIIFSDLEKYNKFECPQELIDKEVRRLATVLLQSENRDEYEILSYCIRESLRNAMEHSEDDRVCICAQYWPHYNKAQNAILDKGIGVLESLTSNSIHGSLSDDLQALEKAIQPAVSSNPLTSQRSNNVWGNSGFGLYMLKKICKDSGSLLISSNKAALLIDKKQSTWGHTGMNGTSLMIEINLERLSELGTLEENLRRYRDESNMNTEPSSSSMNFFSKKITRNRSRIV